MKTIVTLEDIVSALEEYDYPGVWEPGKPVKFLHLYGYRSTNGAVHDYTLRLFHDTSDHNQPHEKGVTVYRRLLRQSLMCLQRQTVCPPQFEWDKYNLTEGDMTNAREELIAAFELSEEKFAQSQEQETEMLRGKEQLTFHAKGAYFTSDTKVDTIVLKNRIRLVDKIVSPAEDTGKPSLSGLNSQHAAIRAKEVYKMYLPLDSYIPRLNLTTDTILAIGII